MPYIHIQISGPRDDALAGRAAEAAAELTSGILHKDRALTAAVVEFIEPGHWFVAGKALASHGPRSYHWMVSITDETNTKDEKARFIEQAYARLSALIGEVHEVSYIHVVDARAAAYGYGGATQEHRYQAARIAAPG